MSLIGALFGKCVCNNSDNTSNSERISKKQRINNLEREIGDLNESIRELKTDIKFLESKIDNILLFIKK